MVRHEDSEATVAKPADDLLQFGYRDRVDGGERLVEQQELRIRSERAGNLRTPPLSAGKRVPQIAPAFCKPKLGQERLRSFAPLAPAQSGDLLENRQHVFLDGEAPEDGRFLREVPDAGTRSLVHGKAGEISMIKGYRALIGLDQSDDHAKRRRLARAVGSQQTHNFAAPDLDCDLIHHSALSVALDQVVAGEHVTPGSIWIFLRRLPVRGREAPLQSILPLRHDVSGRATGAGGGDVHDVLTGGPRPPCSQYGSG